MMPMKGKAAVLFALPFGVAGVAIILIAADLIHVPPGDIHGPRWILAACGGMFAAVGLGIEVYGIRAIRRRAHLKKQLAEHFAEPWYGDYDWNPEGIGDNSRSRLVGVIIGTLFFALFLSPFTWLAFFSQRGIVMVKVIVGVFDAILLLSIVYTIYCLIRQLKFGRGHLRFSRFPFFLGHSLDVQFSNNRGIGRYDKITFTLRYIQERWITRGSGKNRSTSVVGFELYRDTKTIEGPGQYRRGDPPLSITFDLPDGQYDSRLRENPPAYWELEIKAQTAGVDMATSFVLPVYRSASVASGPHFSSMERTAPQAEQVGSVL